HKIRKIRHLRGAKARCTRKKIRAIGAIREHSIISESGLPDNNNIKSGLNSSVGIQPLKFFERCSVTMNKGTQLTGQ
ncbi:hypothetical protein, partial [Prevotellamassilia timonensis]|uniref:hypothetical protein n=1 Tax=Prevotellamassilia timonensis TaxID=1852370 RepID=UPI0030771E8B